MASTGIMAIAYARLKEYLGISSGQIRVFDIGQQLAEVELEVLSRFGADIISLGNSLGDDQPGFWQPWKLPNGISCQIPAGLDIRPDQENGLFRNNSQIRDQRDHLSGSYNRCSRIPGVTCLPFLYGNRFFVIRWPWSCDQLRSVVHSPISDFQP